MRCKMKSNRGENQRAVEKALMALKSDLVNLCEILREERKALICRDRDALFAKLEQKESCFSKLSHTFPVLDKNRDFLKMFGFGNKKAISSQILTQKETHVSKLQNLWHDVMQMISEVKRLNDENNRIIQLSRAFFAEYLKKIKELRSVALGYDKSYAGNQPIIGNMIINKMS
ncbi:MAG: flagellar protein FlgN [Calditrichaeota bacterium]|nr:MAG: flagellar protein FlgN [Calditrichota bacterium]